MPKPTRPAADPFDQAGRLLAARFGEVGDHHAGALAGERQGRRTADAVRGTRHEGDLAREFPVLIVCHRPLPLGKSTLICLCFIRG